MKKKILFVGALQVPGFYFGYQQFTENKLISEYVEENDTSIDDDWERAVAMSQSIRRDFNVNEKSFRVLDYAKQPFLRQNTAFLLKAKEGLCGEGTRVLVNLLYEMGYDATRVTLYNKKLDASHTLVSVIIDNEEYFIDSINTKAPYNEFLNSNQINAMDFNILPYIDNLLERRQRIKEIDEREYKTDIEVQYFDRFRLYSYEAIPLSKLAKAFRLDIRGFNLKRPSKYVSILAEKPNMIMSIFWFIIVNLSLLNGMLLMRLWRIKQAAKQKE